MPNDSQYNTRIVQPEKEKNDRKSEISTLANILKKKENRYQGKLARRRDEIKILKEKSYELALKKKALEERIQKANESLESKTETVDLSLVEETINQLDDGITFSDSDGSENSIFKEEEELHHLILGNHKRKEKINADKEKIFNEKQKLIYQNEARQQHLKSTPTIDTNSFNEDEENELHELYERLVNKESEIEKTNKEIDELISNNNQIKEKVESEYENKMNKISKLSDEITEVDQLVIDIHKIKDSIMSLNEELSQIEHSKKKAQRQNGLISVSINVFQKEKEELEKRGIEAERKLKLLEDKEKQLKERRRKFNEENSLCELNQNSISEKKSEIEQIESNIIKYENKIESTNEEIARQSDIVDKLLLEASSNRADSRIQYFQNILNNDNDSEFNSGKQNFSSDVDI
ncbi:hypothetical protein TRFO_15012 [Tritrichomonas foetus]|uniref:Uncharacterized protein n=1 Tax=Tritrichomonas foetus TaxID=1144522 RepID=A0A1J4KY09_9EUKA|nr:hypothetical protein TRFO_15012 [Tritrichomonas foetus]|eukprot:OHT14598.1 hypothetical protein TRFO_15012 [Tritrichomonas foetus]